MTSDDVEPALCAIDGDFVLEGAFLTRDAVLVHRRLLTQVTHADQILVHQSTSHSVLVVPVHQVLQSLFPVFEKFVVEMQDTCSFSFRVEVGTDGVHQA